MNKLQNVLNIQKINLWNINLLLFNWHLKHNKDYFNWNQNQIILIFKIKKIALNILNNIILIYFNKQERNLYKHHN